MRTSATHRWAVAATEPSTAAATRATAVAPSPMSNDERAPKATREDVAPDGVAAEQMATTRGLDRRAAGQGIAGQRGQDGQQADEGDHDKRDLRADGQCS